MKFDSTQLFKISLYNTHLKKEDSQNIESFKKNICWFPTKKLKYTNRCLIKGMLIQLAAATAAKGTYLANSGGAL